MVPELAGARAAALGMGVVTSGDVWAVQNNIGALAVMETPEIAFSCNTRLNLQELNTFGLVAGYPLRQGIVAADASRYGTGAYHLSTVGLGYSHKISYMSVGLKLSYLQQVIEGFFSRGTLVLEAGGKAELLPDLHFGAHAYNLTQSSMGRDNREAVPVLLKAGLEYLPDEKISLYLQTSKNTDYPARLSTGLEYTISDALQLRTGLMTKPVTASFGLGFRHQDFRFDYAFRHYSTIGAAHHFTIGVALPAKEKL